MIVHASSSVIAAGIKGTMPVPALPFLITQKSSPSFRFLWNLQFVKLRGAGFRIFPASPRPSPSLPWQLKHVPFPSNNAFPLAMFSGVTATGFFMALASAIWSAGTRALSGSRSSAAYAETDNSISAALIPRNLEKYPIRCPPLCLTTTHELGVWPLLMRFISKRQNAGEYNNGPPLMSSNPRCYLTLHSLPLFLIIPAHVLASTRRHMSRLSDNTQSSCQNTWYGEARYSG